MRPGEIHTASQLLIYEQTSDLAWIRNRERELKPAAQHAFQVAGRGALVIDTTQEPVEGTYPFGYAGQHMLEEMCREDVLRLALTYNPDNSFVVWLLKPFNREASYLIDDVTSDWTHR